MTADDAQMHGPGSYLFASGAQYVGAFSCNQRSGPGKQVWPTGHMYVGQWSEDTPHGMGVLVDGASGVSLAGLWAEGKLVKEVVEQVVLASAAASESGEEKTKNIVVKEGVTAAARAAKLPTRRVIAGVTPFDGHDVRVRFLDGAGGHNLGSPAKNKKDKKKNKNKPGGGSVEGVRRNQIHINSDGTLYVGTTWRGEYHGPGILLPGAMRKGGSVEEEESATRDASVGMRRGPWMMGTTKNTAENRRKKEASAGAIEKRVSHANYALSIQKGQLRHTARRLFSA
jgi:hypothetical protein